MNSGMDSHEGTKARREEMGPREGATARRSKNHRHTRAGGYPGSPKVNIQQAVGQLAGRFSSQFEQEALAQTIDTIIVQRPAALFQAIQTGRVL
jgi:hypothetical protein